jgi:hypothetical protein
LAADGGKLCYLGTARNRLWAELIAAADEPNAHGPHSTKEPNETRVTA